MLLIGTHLNYKEIEYKKAKQTRGWKSIVGIVIPVIINYWRIVETWVYSSMKQSKILIAILISVKIYKVNT